MKSKDVKITNIIFATPAQKGDSSFILGLGDDSRVYYWEEKKGVWELFITK